MDRACFLRSSARELDGLLEVVSERDRQEMIPAAMICSVIANVNRDPDRSDPFGIEDFIPGMKDREWIEWLESLENGEETEDMEAVEAFKRRFKETFRLN